MKINRNSKKGFTLVEIMIVVAIIGLLAAIAIPNFVKARERAQINSCIANLRQINGAIQQWALEGKKGPGDAVVMGDLVPFLSGGVAPTCPVGGAAYTMTTVANPPACPNANLGHALQ